MGTVVKALDFALWPSLTPSSASVLSLSLSKGKDPADPEACPPPSRGVSPPIPRSVPSARGVGPAWAGRGLALCEGHCHRYLYLSGKDCLYGVEMLLSDKTSTPIVSCGQQGPQTVLLCGQETWGLCWPGRVVGLLQVHWNCTLSSCFGGLAVT